MSKTVSGFGITIGLLSGWYGEIYRTVDGFADSGPVLHVANTPLVLGDRDGYVPVTRRNMRPEDAILCLLNLPSLPSIVTAKDVERVGLGSEWSLKGATDIPFHGVGMGRSSLRKALLVGERVFDLIVFFGSDPPSAEQLSRVEMMVNTIRIAAAPDRSGDRIEQFFTIADAIRINEEARRAIWDRDMQYATPADIAAHEAVFPNG